MNLYLLLILLVNLFTIKMSSSAKATLSKPTLRTIMVSKQVNSGTTPAALSGINNKDPKNYKTDGNEMMRKNLIILRNFLTNVKKFKNNVKLLSVVLNKKLEILTPAPSRVSANKKELQLPISYNYVKNGTKSMNKIVMVQNESFPKTIKRSSYSTATIYTVRAMAKVNCKNLLCPTKQKAAEPQIKKFDSEGKITPPKGVNGAVIVGCNNTQFFFSSATVSIPKLYSACCELGMELATFSSRQEFDCMFQLYFNNIVEKKEKMTDTWSNYFFVSYFDFKLEDSFTACNSYGGISTPQMWASNEPDNKMGAENCVSVNLFRGQNSSGLADISCMLGLRYICSYKNNTTVT